MSSRRLAVRRPAVEWSSRSQPVPLTLVASWSMARPTFCRMTSPQVSEKHSPHRAAHEQVKHEHAERVDVDGGREREAPQKDLRCHKPADAIAKKPHIECL
jgi:hypothetical protein